MYEIVFGEKTVGKAVVTKEGLYYKISCLCKPPDKKLYRISVSDGIAEKDLGICVPDGTGFTLRASVPVKHLKGDSLLFTMVPHDRKSTESEKQVGVPVQTGGAFHQLDKLQNARLRLINGQTVIVTD